jgi:hypothetical protein
MAFWVHLSSKKLRVSIDFYFEILVSAILIMKLERGWSLPIRRSTSAICRAFRSAGHG